MHSIPSLCGVKYSCRRNSRTYEAHACIMRLHLKTTSRTCILFVSIAAIATVLELIFTTYGSKSYVMVKFKYLPHLSSFYNYTDEKGYEKAGREDIYMNYRLFPVDFETINSVELLRNRRTELPKVALCILSHANNFGMRYAARKTWANLEQMPIFIAQNTIFWFILGTSLSAKENHRVLKEKVEFGDIIIGNFTDNNDNDTLKLLFSMHFVTTYYPSVEEIYFGFDSTYVHIQHLVKKLIFREKMGVGQWRGYVIEGMKVERGAIYSPVYPTFCTLNNGFTISASLGKKFVSIARNKRLFVLPDVFIGMLASRINMQIVKDVSFGSQINFPNQTLCGVRATMTTFTFVRNVVKSWKTLTNVVNMAKCLIPDVDVVLPEITDNGPYFKRVLEYLNKKGSKCSSPTGLNKIEGTFIVALISSYVGNFEQRVAIRETWGSQQLFLGRVVRLIFVLGKPTKNKNETQAKVNEESARYGDIIQGNFDESFRNLTLKVVLGLKWVTEFCPDAMYLYKGDDDVFVAWSRIFMFLLKTSDRSDNSVMKRFFVGSVMIGSVRVLLPKSKYFVSENIYHGKFYPRYCSGGSYILSTDTISDLYRRSLITPIIPIDDVYQGILAEQIGLHPVHSDGFKVTFGKEACILQDPDTFTLHGFKSSTEIRKVWKRYVQKKSCLEDP